MSQDNSIPTTGPWSSFWHLWVKHMLKSWLERQQTVKVVSGVLEPQTKQTSNIIHNCPGRNSIPSTGSWSSFLHLRVKHKLKSWLERQHPVVVVAGVPQQQQLAIVIAAPQIKQTNIVPGQ